MTSTPTLSDDPLPGGDDGAARADGSLADLLLLDYCETGVPPIPAAIRRIHEHAHELNRYPRGIYEEATRAVARAHGVNERQVLLTSGADEATDLVLLETRGLTCVTPGFAGYWERSEALDIPTTRLQLTREWELPERWQELARSGSAFLVAQPGNPTGSYFADRSWLDQALATFPVVVVDETYRLVAQSPAETCVDRRVDNLLVFVSLSKAYGLAGIRIGALIGEAVVIERLARRKRFHSVDSISLHAVIGALEDPDAVASAIDSVKQLRPAYVAALERASGLFAEVRTTDCTFVLGRVRESIGATRLVAELALRGVRVTDCSALGLPGWIRVGIADAAAIDRLSGVLRQCESGLDADGKHVASLLVATPVENDLLGRRPARERYAAADLSTPFFRLSPRAVAERVEEFRACFPDAWIRYPVKCNPHESVLRAVRSAGGGFEVASLPEMHQVLALGTPPEQVLFGAPVKPLATIAESVNAGVRTFVADSADEVDKLAEAAPEADVYLRLAVDDPTSILPLSSKFGAQAIEVPHLIQRVQDAGLIPAAVMFHVGSQTTDPGAWARALGVVLDILNTMADTVRIPVVDIGGGFPHRYHQPVPSIFEIAAQVRDVLRRAPYPIRIVLEPGRALTAGCASLVSSVAARVTRNDQEWLFLDAGIYHGLSEAALPGRPLRFSVRLADRQPRTAHLRRFTLTGPTCDSLDVIDLDVLLPDCVGSGDRIAIDAVGAYSSCLSTSFNGFPPPPVVLGNPSEPE